MALASCLVLIMGQSNAKTGFFQPHTSGLDPTHSINGLCHAGVVVAKSLSTWISPGNLREVKVSVRPQTLRLYLNVPRNSVGPVQ